jgi:hypothetical protein
MPEDQEEHTLRLDRAFQNNAFQTWRLAGRTDGFVQRSTAVRLPGQVPSVIVGSGAAASTTALDFLRTQASALRNHLALSAGSGRMFAFCVAPGTPTEVAAQGARVLLCEVEASSTSAAAAAAAAGAGGRSARPTVTVAADVSLGANSQDSQQRLAGDALDASVVVVEGSRDGTSGPLALVSLGRGDLRAVRLGPTAAAPATAAATATADDDDPPATPPLPLSAALYPLRPAAPLSGVRPFVLAAAAVLPPPEAGAADNADDDADNAADNATAPATRVRCVAWAVADHFPDSPGAAQAENPSSRFAAPHARRKPQQHIRHVCELWSFELRVGGGGGSTDDAPTLVSRRRLLRSPAAPHAVQLLLPRLDAVLAAVEPREEEEAEDDEEDEAEANDDQEAGGVAAAATAAAAAPSPAPGGGAATAAAAAAGNNNNNQAAAGCKGDEEDDEDGDDMSPRTLRAAAAALAKFTSERLDEGGNEGGGGGAGDGARTWAPPAADLLHETGADGEGGMGDEPQLVLRLVPCVRRRATTTTTNWRCSPHRLLSAEQAAVVAAAAPAAAPQLLPPPSLLVALSDDVDCAVVTATVDDASQTPSPPVRVEHRATVPALAYVLAGKTQRRHLLLAPPPPPAGVGGSAGGVGAVAAALIEGRRYAYLYGRVPDGASVGAQEVIDLFAAARAGGAVHDDEQQDYPQQQHTVLGARLVMAAAGGEASAAAARLLVLTDRSLLEFELR